jgi:hypothetical protein
MPHCPCTRIRETATNLPSPHGRIIFTAIALTLAGGCGSGPAAEPSKEVTTSGSVEVTARLEEIRGTPPVTKLYRYAFIMKYRVLRVHRGKVEGDEILVAHYEPLKPRAEAGDKWSGPVGGNVVRLSVGEVHRMALEPTMDAYMGAIIDPYFSQPGARHWAVWTEYGAE